MTSPLDTDGLRRQLRQALAHHRAGRKDQASAGYRAILDQAPEHPDALHYSGVIALERGDHAGAVRLMDRAAAGLGGDADFNANYGVALRAMGKPEQAKACLGRALARNPRHGLALYNLGLLLMGERDWAGATAIFGRIAEHNPDSGEIAHLLGQALAGQGDLEAARIRYRDAIRLDGAALEPRLDLAELELAQGRPAEAEAVLGQAAERTTNLKAPALMAEIRDRQGDGKGRDEWLARARAIEPRAADVLFQAGAELQEAQIIDEARRLFRQSLMIEPGHPNALWSGNRLLPTIYDDEVGIETARRGYEAGLSALESVVRAARDAASIQAAFDAMMRQTNFFLAYQERDDRDLQIRYGRMAQAVVAARFPQFPACPPAPEPEPDGRLRIGIFSRYFRIHTVSRLYAGWFEKLDRRRFKLFGYHVGEEDDPVRRLLASRCEVFRPLGRAIMAAQSRPFAERFADLGRTVAADRLHALLFPEIGMDATTYYLATLRLAPVQAVGIGHPVTTGLPNIDYFLSGELIEPEGAEKHYSEQLIRLPNISLRLFDPAAAPRTARRARGGFGFAADDVVYLSSQSLMKYLPRYDRIFPAIAKAIPNARFAFIRPGQPTQEAVFLSRLTRAFAAEGLERDRFCRFFDSLPMTEFSDLNDAADVYLDTPGWSGGHTTHEAIAAGLPVVTLPGQFMRGRVSHGMLRMIGVEDTVAKDVDDYIAIAVRLGNDEGWRRQMRAKIEANRGKLYDDQACVRGLEDFLIRAVAEKTGKS